MADPIQLFDGAPIRMLLIEDDDDDYRRTCDLLDAARHVTFVIDWARGVKDAALRLGSGTYDVCLVDHGLPDGRGLDLVHAARDRGVDAPIVMLTGCSTLELDLEAMALGVSDFLDKRTVDATLLAARNVIDPSSPPVARLEEALSELSATARAARAVLEILEREPAALVRGLGVPE